MTQNKTYQSSGVNIHQANAFVRSIQGLMKSTFSSSVLKNKDAFGSLFALDLKKYKKPILVSSADGVGTKLLIAQQVNKHDTVGIDLVAMNVNDILCMGAQPLFFLDYIACGKIDKNVLKEVMKGIVKGCRMAGCSLIGGETAEMPGLYKEGDYDLAGFAVGIVDQDRLLNGQSIRPGDRLLGLASSGIHSNGYSLVRNVLSLEDQKALAKLLLTPTRIYVREVSAALKKFPIKAIAHITGGAYYEKLTKIVPPGRCFEVDRRSWKTPEIFQIIQKKGKISTPEMFRTFNMGIGMVLVVPAGIVLSMLQFFSRNRVKAFDIGKVILSKDEKIKYLDGETGTHP